MKLGRRKQVFRKLILPPTSGKGSLHNHSNENPKYHSLYCKTNDIILRNDLPRRVHSTLASHAKKQDQTKTQAYRLSSITFWYNPSGFLKHIIRTIPGRTGANKKGSCRDETGLFRRLSILCCSISSTFQQKVKLRSFC